jgi:hypothetical protein
MAGETFPLEDMCPEIMTALSSSLPYLAAAATLSIPDICSSLEWDPDPNKIKEQRRAQQDRYKKWFDDYLARNYNHLTADDCYRLRCGLLHNGKLGRPKDSYDRVAFSMGNSPIEMLYDNNIVNGVNTGKLLVLGLDHFCKTTICAARTWYESKNDDHFVKMNAITLIKLRKDGVRPFFSGVPALVGDTAAIPDFGGFVMVSIA